MIRAFLIALVVILGIHGGAEVTGRVIGVTDGDTLTLLTLYRGELTIRLIEIDAPERDQPWGERSEQTLSALVWTRDVRVVDNGKDIYGRTLGRVYLGTTDVNAEMVRSGSAWAYQQYVVDSSLVRLEQQAKKAKLGLWSLPADQIIAPWEWRPAPPRPVLCVGLVLSSSPRECARVWNIFPLW